MKYGKGVFAGAVTAVLGVRTAAAQMSPTSRAPATAAWRRRPATAAPCLLAISTAAATSAARSRSATPYGPDPDVYGGDILNQTGLAVAVDGGTAIADATGGNNNLAFVS